MSDTGEVNTNTVLAVRTPESKYLGIRWYVILIFSVNAVKYSVIKNIWTQFRKSIFQN
jgi:hypothetical protein